MPHFLFDSYFTFYGNASGFHRDGGLAFLFGSELALGAYAHHFLVGALVGDLLGAVDGQSHRFQGFGLALFQSQPGRNAVDGPGLDGLFPHIEGDSYTGSRLGLDGQVYIAHLLHGLDGDGAAHLGALLHHFQSLRTAGFHRGNLISVGHTFDLKAAEGLTRFQGKTGEIHSQIRRQLGTAGLRLGQSAAGAGIFIGFALKTVASLERVQPLQEWPVAPTTTCLQSVQI